MAGFAVVMTFLVWGLIALAVAFITSVFLYFRARARTPETRPETLHYRVSRSLMPFAALLWFPIALSVHTFISNKLARQSVGFSPDPYVTLPNDYVVGSQNTYDGYVKAPNASIGLPWVGPGYVRNLIDIIFRNGRFEGTYLDSHSDVQPQGTDHVRSFVFDTRDRSIQTFDGSDVIDFGTQQDRVHADATAYWVLYESYRHKWPVFLFWLVFLGGEAFIIWQFRRISPPRAHDL